MTTELPAGYIVFSGMALHVSEVRKYTSDIERLKRHLPLIEKMEGVTPGNAEAQALYAKIDDIEAFGLSLIESGNLLTDIGTALKEDASAIPGLLVEVER